MVYLLRSVRWRDRGTARYGVSSARPRLFCACLHSTAHDVRVVCRACVGLYDIVRCGRPWWTGWLLEVDAARLVAMGVVREVSVTELREVFRRAATGDGLVIR